MASFVLKAVLSALLLWFALYRVDWTVVALRLRNIDAGWAVLGLTVLFLQNVLFGLRWRLIAVRSNVALTVRQAVYYSFVAAFFNQTMPSTVGGDAARIVLLRRGGAAWGAATYSVIIDRVVGLLALTVIVITTLPWALATISDTWGRLSLLAIAFGSFACVIVVVMLGALDQRWTERWWVTAQLAGVCRLAHRVLVHPPGNVSVMVLSICVHALTMAAVWFIARSVSAPIGVRDVILLVPPIILVTMVPISIGGWGIREGATMAAFSFAGLGQGDGLVVSILLGAGLFVVGAVGGAIWIVKGGRGATRIAGDSAVSQ